MLGAGGAASGVISELLKKKNTVFILNRTIKKAKILEKRFKNLGEIFCWDMSNNNFAKKKFDIIINATSCSMYNTVPDFPKHIIKYYTCCYDLFYSKKNTMFLKFCKENGAKYLFDGKGMLVSQAAFAFFLWYKKFPDIISTLNYICSI